MRIVKIVFLTIFLFSSIFVLIAFTFNIEQNNLDKYLSEELESSVTSGNLTGEHIVDIERICIFSQDDSDKNVALDNLLSYLKENKIQPFNQKWPENPQNIILFMHPTKEISLLFNKRFKLGGKWSYLLYDGYEENRRFCRERKFIRFKNYMMS